MRRCILLLCLLPVLASAARAHQPGLSHLAVQIRTNAVECDLIVSWTELENVLPLDSDANGELSNDEFASAKAKLRALGDGAIALSTDGKPLVRLSTLIDRDDSTGVRFVTRWVLPPQASSLRIRSELLPDLQQGHRQILSVRGVTNAPLAQLTLTRERPQHDVSLLETGTSVDHTFAQFLWLGVEHILSGWDHLTFLLGLLIVGGKARESVKIITSFTVAHSITLVLATLDVIRFPDVWVEIIIAASIVYVGIENLCRHSYRGRWLLTFFFGLIHGCGFATALRERGIEVDGGSVWKPLLSFNLGVELGQLAIAAVVLPWIWKLQPKFSRWWIPALSTIVALLGAWLLLERTLLAR